MKADVKTNHSEYTIDNIISVTYSDGNMILIFKDNDGTLASVMFSASSLKDGTVFIH